MTLSIKATSDGVEHTPGPWRASLGRHVWRTFRDEQNRRCHTPIAEACETLQMKDGELAANARLIAAAPDLYEALKDAALIFEETAKDLTKIGQHGLALTLDGDAKRCRAALAKAKPHP